MEDWDGAVSKGGEKTAEGSISVAKRRKYFQKEPVITSIRCC